jgi:hypothetical protein
MNSTFEMAVDDLMPPLLMNRPRGGAHRVWPGLSDRLQTAPQWLGFEPRATNVSLIRAGVAELCWVGDEVIVSLFVSSVGAEALRRTLVLAALISTHAPTAILQPGDATLGDGSFSIAGLTQYFSRGNLGAMVRSESRQKPAGDIAWLLDDAIQTERTIEPAALSGLLPRIADFRVSSLDVPVGETVRATLTIAPAWADRARAFFDYSTEFLSADFPEEHLADLTGVEPGNTQVHGCAVEKTTLLCASQMVAITVRPGQRPTPPEEEPEEGPIPD